MPKLFGIDAPEVQTKGRVEESNLTRDSELILESFFHINTIQSEYAFQRRVI